MSFESGFETLKYFVITKVADHALVLLLIPAVANTYKALGDNAAVNDTGWAFVIILAFSPVYYLLPASVFMFVWGSFAEMSFRVFVTLNSAPFVFLVLASAAMDYDESIFPLLSLVAITILVPIGLRRIGWIYSRAP